MKAGVLLSLGRSVSWKQQVVSFARSYLFHQVVMLRRCLHSSNYGNALKYGNHDLSAFHTSPSALI